MGSPGVNSVYTAIEKFISYNLTVVFSIHSAPIVSKGADFYIFGGQNYVDGQNPISNVIAKYSKERWTKVGELVSPRYG